MQDLGKLIDLTVQLEQANTNLVKDDALLLKKNIAKITNLELFDASLDDAQLTNGVERLLTAMGPDAVRFEKARVMRERQKTQLEIELEPLYEQLFTSDDQAWQAYMKARMVASLQAMRELMSLARDEDPNDQSAADEQDRPVGS